MENKKIFLISSSILSFMLIGILLFPPFEIERKNYKFFDFVFNSEFVIKKVDGSYNYTVDSRERKITKTDTSDALNLEPKNLN